MSDLTPLSEIMDEFMKDLQSGSPEATHRESAFRRGYHQGYDKAIEDIMGLLHRGMSIYQAHRLMALQVNLLGGWRADKEEMGHVPPEFNRMNLLETLEHRNRPQLEEDYEEYEEEGD